MHTSHRSHGFRHWVTWVQGGHFCGFPKPAAVHEFPIRTGPGSPGTAQQPKQSQPLGTSLLQRSTQICVCEDDREHHSGCAAAYTAS